MKLNPPRLTRGPLSGDIFIVTHGKIMGADNEGREIVDSTVKHDITDQFYSMMQEQIEIDLKCLNYQKSIHHSDSNLDLTLKLGKNVRSK